MKDTQTSSRVRRAFFKHKLGVIGLFILAILYLSVLFADFISPCNYLETHRNYEYAPPSKIRWTHEGKWQAPFVYGIKKIRDIETLTVSYIDDTTQIYPIKWFTRGESYRFLGVWETDIHLFGLGKEARGFFFLFGADRFGRDVFSRILQGGRVSLTAGLVGTFISVVIGAIIGALSGYFGGVMDTLIQRFIEILRSFPRIPLWLTLALIIPPGWPSTWVYMGIVVVLAFIGWMGVARVIRGMTLSLREKEFVIASRLVGQSNFKIIVKHLIPNMMTYLVVVATLSIPGMILGESAISFLGLGIKEPMTSWGLLLKQAQTLTDIEANPWLMIPGLFIMVSVLCFNFVGDALRDALDPYRTVEKV